MMSPHRTKHHAQKWWLITGAGSGLGLAITLAALRAGDRVIGTVRDVEAAAKEHPEIEQMGGLWLKLDVTSSDVEHSVARAIENFGGKLDVVVNNAGYLILTSLEDVRIEDVTAMFDTHVLGAIRILKGALPTLRAQKSGTIVNMSSFSGIVGHAGTGVYSLCKFALEGISETYQHELAPFNIRVLVLEPGAFRTSITKRSRQQTGTEGISEHYLETNVGTTIRVTDELAARPDELIAGDPAKLAQVVVELVHGSRTTQGLQDVLRVPLGEDALHFIEGKAKRLCQDIELTRSLAISTSYDGHIGKGAADISK